MNDNFLKTLENTDSVTTEEPEITFAKMKKDRKTLLDGQQMVFVKPEKYDGIEIRKAMVESNFVNATVIKEAERIDSLFVFDPETGVPKKVEINPLSDEIVLKELKKAKEEISLSNFAVEDILKGSYLEIFEEHTKRIQKYFEQRKFLTDHEIKQEIWELERILKDFRKEVTE